VDKALDYAATLMDGIRQVAESLLRRVWWMFPLALVGLLIFDVVEIVRFANWLIERCW
jgi:hypothetical protein